MKIFLNLLIICFLLLSCEFFDHNSREIDELTSKRNEVANIIKNSAGAIKANWESPQVLVLTFRQDAIDKMFKTSKEIYGSEHTFEKFKRELALAYAIFAVQDVGMKVCVRIEYADGQQVAYKCKE